jgi:hypothetical protein
MNGGGSPKCPACQARFRGTADCSRCGADLRPLMALAVRAWRRRCAARQALLDGHFAAAAGLAAQAQATCPTPLGRQLHLLARFVHSAQL